MNPLKAPLSERQLAEITLRLILFSTTYGSSKTLLEQEVTLPLDENAFYQVHMRGSLPFDGRNFVISKLSLDEGQPLTGTASCILTEVEGKDEVLLESLIGRGWRKPGPRSE